MLKTPSALRIAIIGAGNIGSAFTFHLSRVGCHEVTVVARPGSVRLRQLERDVAIVDVKGARANVLVADALDEQVAYDLVIVTVLAHQVDPILPTLQRSATKCVQFMFNTFDPDRLEAAIGTDRCAFGMPFVQAIVDADGRLNATVGAGGQKTLMSRQRWVDVFTAAGLPASLEPDMPLWLRCHTPLCVAFQSISVAGERRGGGASWSEALVVARGTRASFMLIKGLGYDLYPRSKKRIAASPTAIVAAALWFVSRIRSFRQLLATGKGECRALIAAMVAAEPRATPPVTLSDIQAMTPS